MDHQKEHESIEDYVERVKSTIRYNSGMKALRNEHLYILENVSDKDGFQMLQFAETVPKFEGAAEQVLVQDGTTTEAVLQMLMDRCLKIQEKNPSQELDSVIHHIEKALIQLELKTLRRKH
jgi:hypothetical protein